VLCISRCLCISRQLVDEERYKEATFQPQIAPVPEEMVHLIEAARAGRRVSRQQQFEEAAKKRKEMLTLEETRECTFQPKIPAAPAFESVDTSKLRGFNRHRALQQRARLEREEQAEALANLGRVRDRSKWKVDERGHVVQQPFQRAERSVERRLKQIQQLEKEDVAFAEQAAVRGVEVTDLGMTLAAAERTKWRVGTRNIHSASSIQRKPVPSELPQFGAGSRTLSPEEMAALGLRPKANTQHPETQHDIAAEKGTTSASKSPAKSPASGAGVENQEVNNVDAEGQRDVDDAPTPKASSPISSSNADGSKGVPRTNSEFMSYGIYINKEDGTSGPSDNDDGAVDEAGDELEENAQSEELDPHDVMADDSSLLSSEEYDEEAYEFDGEEETVAAEHSVDEMDSLGAPQDAAVDALGGLLCMSRSESCICLPRDFADYVLLIAVTEAVDTHFDSNAVHPRTDDRIRIIVDINVQNKGERRMKV